MRVRPQTKRIILLTPTIDMVVLSAIFSSALGGLGVMWGIKKAILLIQN